MNCKIVSLNESTYASHSYETISPHSNKIAHEAFGKGIIKNREFTKYIVYIKSGNAYFATHLSYTHCASYGGRLCTTGHMDLMPSTYEEVMSNSTHFPIIPMDVNGFELNNAHPIGYLGEEEMVVSLYDTPDTCVFKFSCYGGDERTPSGYIYVNMELFKPKECK